MTEFLLAQFYRLFEFISDINQETTNDAYLINKNNHYAAYIFSLPRTSPVDMHFSLVINKESLFILKSIPFWMTDILITLAIMQLV